MSNTLKNDNKVPMSVLFRIVLNLQRVANDVRICITEKVLSI